MDNEKQFSTANGGLMNKDDVMVWGDSGQKNNVRHGGNLIWD
ncbi:MAG: hypothetical protein NTV68_00345 [Methanomicrobiales archaeon]|nr:hypothetical protein [Methanomicrobiales archaeon]